MNGSISVEALEAAGKALYEAEPVSAPSSARSWEHAGRITRQIFIDRARPVVAAALGISDALVEPEWEYAVEDYRSPGYMIIGDVLMSEADREIYYGSRPLVRRIKSGPWERVDAGVSVSL